MATSTENIVVQFDIEASKGAKSIRMMRQEMKDLQLQMEQASEAGDKVTFQKLAKNYGELKNDMRDFREEMNAMDKGEVLTNTIKMVQGAVGAFGALTASASLFGVENEKLQEIEKKSMQVIQLMMGLEEARKLLIDQGAIARNKATLETAKNTVVEWANSVSKNASARAEASKLAMQNAGNIATKTATAIQWAWNASLSAFPIVAVVAGVVAFAGAVYLLAGNLNDESEKLNIATANQKKYNEAKRQEVDLAISSKGVNERLLILGKLNERQKQQLKDDIDVEIAKREDLIATAEKEMAAELRKNQLYIVTQDEQRTKVKKMQEEIAQFKVSSSRIIIKTDKEEKETLIENSDKYYEDLIKGMQEANARIDDEDAKRTEDINQRNKEISEARKQDAEDEKQYYMELENEKAMRQWQSVEDKKKADEEKYQSEMRLLSATSMAFGELSGLMKKGSQEAKTFALAKIAIDTAISIAESVKDASIAGITPIEKGIIFATSLAQIMAGIGQAKQVLSTASYARGGLIRGAGTGVSDSINANVSNGEAILTAKSMRVPAFRQLASAINVAGGGISFATNKTQSENSVITATISRADVSEVVRSIPVTVLERDISKTQRKVRTIESRSQY